MRVPGGTGYLHVDCEEATPSVPPVGARYPFSGTTLEDMGF